MTLQRNLSVIRGITVATEVATSTAIPYHNCAGGTVYVPSAGVTAITWYGSYDGVTYSTLKDGAGVDVTSTVANGQACPIPDECFGCAFLKPVDGSGGTIHVSLKS